MAKDSLQAFVDLRRALEQERAELQQRLQKIESALNNGGSVASGRQGRSAAARVTLAAAPRAKRSKPAKRGSLKNDIGAVLQQAGKNGLHVKEIASAIGSKPANVTAWFYQTGRKAKEIKKVAPATFAWTGAK
jgi:hypothetical protein